MKTKDLTLASLLAVLTFISSYFSFPIGPVPVTLQTTLVLLTGLLLKPSTAFLAQFTNVILMCLFRSSFASPTFGFLLGFILAATALAYMKEKKFNLILAILIASILVYVIGVPYFTVLLSEKYTLISALNVTFTPFIIGDTIKAVVAYILANRLQKLLKI